MKCKMFGCSLLRICLAISWLFWGMAFLYLPRISSVFLPVHKLFGPVIYVIMLGGPLACLGFGVWMLWAGVASRLSWTAIASGVLLTAAFMVLMGVPLIQKTLHSYAAVNSGVPRPLPPQADLPVFPGAEGFGTRTPAGRGGKVLFVTSLSDSGPGSLREALNQPFPRTILFRVGGTIELVGELQIAHPFVTVAGQSAPGDGILIRNAGLAVMTHDVLVRHLRIRPGDRGRINPEVNDALSILNPGRGRDQVYNVVIDHCSFSWSEDEVVSSWYAARDITLSWCIISEALDRARHPKKTHSAGLLIGDASDRVTVHHCLLAHNDFRNPLIIGGTHDFSNNVIYNWGDIPAEIYDHGGLDTRVNFTGNAYRAGPSTTVRPFTIILDRKAVPNSPRLFVADNLTPRRTSSQVEDWTIVGLGWGDVPAPRTHQATEPFPVAPVTGQAADDLEWLLHRTGATLPRRDPVDERIVNDVRTGRGRIIDSPDDVGGYPVMHSGAPPVDADHDGMPDEWERARGLDPIDPTDGAARSSNGYTHLENYLHELAGDPVPGKPYASPIPPEP